MLFITCDVDLTRKMREKIRQEVKDRTGEDCVILDGGRFTIQEIAVKRDGK